jgi:hypothetical protein
MSSRSFVLIVLGVLVAYCNALWHKQLAATSNADDSESLACS